MYTMVSSATILPFSSWIFLCSTGSLVRSAVSISSVSMNSNMYLWTASSCPTPRSSCPFRLQSRMRMSLPITKIMFGVTSMTTLDMDSACASAYGMHMDSSALPWKTATAFSRQVEYPHAPQFSSSSGEYFPGDLRILRICSSDGMISDRLWSPNSFASSSVLMSGRSLAAL